MKSLVLELQHEALDSSTPTPDAVRKALVVARKLNIQGFDQWAVRELDGYPEDSDVPEYRIIRGQVKAWNPYHGWVPMITDNSAYMERLSTRATRQGVGELESLLADRKSNRQLQMPFSATVEAQIMRGSNVPLKPTLIVPPVSLVRILDNVRSIVLSWALQLEKDGIIGEGMSFNKHEREIAIQNTYNTTNFYGSVEGSQIQQFSTNSEQFSSGVNITTLIKFLDQVIPRISDLGLSPELEKKADDILEILSTEAKSPQPNSTTLQKGLRSLQTIVEGAVGSLLASGILTELSKLLPS